MVTELRAESDRLRLLMLEVHRRAGAGHLGSALSIAEILTAILGRHFRWSHLDDEQTCGDRLVLSKGHAALGLYCSLALAGKIEFERLLTFGRNGSVLEPHPNESTEPALHASTGSLGQGLSIGVGLALGSRMLGNLDRTFVIIGDGELNEGQIWEAARSAAFLGLRNLVVVLDDNGMQQDGPTAEIMPVRDALECFRSIGWITSECDGHDCDALDASLQRALAASDPRPRLIRATTVKGRGVDFLEGRTESHYPPPLSADELALVRYVISRGVA
ncbi:MAG: transketolase [Deltaproteobacteria bacterium]|nr:transketolase [Deltaproteobacteria bacterium]